MLNLGGGSSNLDVVFVMTTNDKHLDAFKVFLILVPLRVGLNSFLCLIFCVQDEVRIGEQDIKTIAQYKTILLILLVFVFGGVDSS